MIDALMALAEFEQDHNEVSQAEAWGRMFALTLINLPLHMNDETYIAHLRHARAHIEAELGELQAQTVH